MRDRSDEQSEVEEYIEQINSQKAHIKSLQYQLTDLKSYIINQKTMHAREIQSLRQTVRQLEGKMEKNCKEEQPSQPNSSKGPSLIVRKTLKQQKQSGSTIELETARQILTQMWNYFQGQLAMLGSDVANRLKALNVRVKKLSHFVHGVKQTAAANRLSNKMVFKSLEDTLGERNRLVERQKRLIDQMVNDKKQSDNLYEKQLSFLQDARDQRRYLIERMERTNSQLQQYSNYRETNLGKTLDGYNIIRDFETTTVGGHPEFDTQAFLASSGPIPSSCLNYHKKTRLSNPIIEIPSDDIYQRIPTESFPFNTTDRETPHMKNKHHKIKDNIRRTMSNLTSPNKQPVKTNVVGSIANKVNMNHEDLLASKQKIMQQVVTTAKRRILKKNEGPQPAMKLPRQAKENRIHF